MVGVVLIMSHACKGSVLCDVTDYDGICGIVVCNSDSRIEG